MTLFALLSFIFLGLSYLSLWIRKDVRLWGTFLLLSVISGLIDGLLLWTGVFWVVVSALLWYGFSRQKATMLRTILFIALLALGASYIIQIIPGFIPIAITDKFKIGLQKPLFCIFPLALLIPLAKNIRDWRKVGLGILIGCSGIALLAVLAIASGSVHWQYKIPTHPETRYLANFFLTSMPEEAFYRGFVQNEFCRFFQGKKGGNLLALFLTSVLFTFSHVFWSPNLAILIFVFIASLLYGGVYLISGRIESAILTHFLLNALHMTFFSYHAM